jgi:N-hydroxyarylamine O-acetyltransferase
MDLKTYLNRIQYPGDLTPDAKTLAGLQQAHLLTVPFENLDIGLLRPIKLDEASLWEKIIVQKRGGFCYELNGLFAWLLKQIGFDVTYLNARVFDGHGNPGIEFDHLALLAQAPGESERWLVDVGFGDSFIRPLHLAEPTEQAQGLRAYRIEQTPAGYVTWQRNYAGRWERQYIFDLSPHDFPADYEAACLYHQTSPDSPFTRQSIISRATPEGRVSLEAGRLILTEHGQRTEHPLADEAAYKTLLKQYFGITLAG